MPVTRGGRPIKISQVSDHYQTHIFKDVSLNEYAKCWKSWLTTTKLKTILGLEKFAYIDFTCGSSQTFDHFVLKHSHRQISALIGDFQYHACISRFNRFAYVDHIQKDQALIISLPFSDLGTEHPEFRSVLEQCNKLNVPVCLDLAYWGVAKNVSIDLDQYPCITEITSSLSKSFYTLENHRVGVRFSREYPNDGISMLNEVKMQNTHSMSLGLHFMQRFSADWVWSQLAAQYYDICFQNQLTPTDTIIFALGDQSRHAEFNRGIKDNFRVCVSEMFNA